MIEEAARRIREGGECLLASPEGTRSHDGRLLPMKRGVFMLARKALRPIVCVTVIGGHERMPRGACPMPPRRGRRRDREETLAPCGRGCPSEARAGEGSLLIARRSPLNRLAR
mgnify:CR=1 FL=1